MIEIDGVWYRESYRDVVAYEHVRNFNIGKEGSRMDLSLPLIYHECIVGRNHLKEYWNQQVIANSCFITTKTYLGLGGALDRYEERDKYLESYFLFQKSPWIPDTWIFYALFKD